MNIDDRIRQELQRDRKEVDEILAEEDGLLGRLGPAYRGGLKRYVYLVTAIAVVLTGLIFWSGYRFFTAPDVAALVFWGVILIIALIAQVAMKLWIWMEMNRSLVVRETKRLELALARLEERLDDRFDDRNEQ